MGNCQGKKASSGAVTTSAPPTKPSAAPVKAPAKAPVPVTSAPAKPESSVGIKTATTETANPESQTKPTTPEKISEVKSPASSDSAKVEQTEEVSEPDAATDETAVVKGESADPVSKPVSDETAEAVDAETPEDVALLKSDVESAVAENPPVPTSDGETAVASNETKTETDVVAKSDTVDNSPTLETEVIETEVESKKGLISKVDAIRDSCCGVPPADVDVDTNGDVIETAPSEAASEVPTAAVTKDPSGTEAEAEAANEAPSLAAKSRSEVSKATSAAPSVAVSTVSSADFTLDASDPNYKKKRKLLKKLREIEAIESKDQDSLTPDQKQKLGTKDNVLQSLTDLS